MLEGVAIQLHSQCSPIIRTLKSALRASAFWQCCVADNSSRLWFSLSQHGIWDNGISQVNCNTRCSVRSVWRLVSTPRIIHDYLGWRDSYTVKRFWWSVPLSTVSLIMYSSSDELGTS